MRLRSWRDDLSTVVTSHAMEKGSIEEPFFTGRRFSRDNFRPMSDGGDVLHHPDGAQPRPGETVNPSRCAGATGAVCPTRSRSRPTTHQPNRKQIAAIAVAELEMTRVEADIPPLRGTRRRTAPVPVVDFVQIRERHRVNGRDALFFHPRLIDQTPQLFLGRDSPLAAALLLGLVKTEKPHVANAPPSVVPALPDAAALPGQLRVLIENNRTMKDVSTKGSRFGLLRTCACFASDSPLGVTRMPHERGKWRAKQHANHL